MQQVNLKLFSKLITPETRQIGARELAETLKSKDLVIFDFDAEIKALLPAIGFPQTLWGTKHWRNFLAKCERDGWAAGELPCNREGQLTKVTGKLFGTSVWVLFEANLETLAILNNFKDFALSLSGLLQNERRNFKFVNQNVSLQELTKDLQVHTEALNLTRNGMNQALRDAESARLEAEKANQAKSVFLANMSHEIRTPLSAIIGFAAILREPLISDKDRLVHAEVIERNGRQLARIIDDILDIAKVEAGRIELENIKFSFLELMDDVIQLFSQEIRKKNLTLHYEFGADVPTYIESDPVRLRQVLINIIGNAVKFTESGGISVQVFRTSAAGLKDNIEIHIVDSGCGISEEQRRRIFKPFMQADCSTTRRYGGTGLGLALSLQLMEAMGGSIQHQQNSAEYGSTFVISFSVRSCQAANTITFSREKIYNSLNSKTYQVNAKEILQKSTPTELLKDMRILMVDDVLDNVLLMKKILSKQGAIVDEACNGREGVRKALLGDFDVVLMDIQMPEMDGYEALRQLKANHYSKPIFALTAQAMKEDRDRINSAGFDSYLTKPINREQLFMQLREVRKNLPTVGPALLSAVQSSDVANPNTINH